MKKDELKEEIERVTDPVVREVLKDMRDEYKSLTSLLGFGITLWQLLSVLVVVGLVIVAFVKGYHTVRGWFLSLDGGFTRSGVTALLFSLVGLPAAYGYGKRRGRK